MAPLLGNLISPAQSAFIKWRNLADNYLLAQSLIHRYGRKQLAPKCMAKIDLQKAYDTISWDFLHEVLRGLHFHPCFIHWVMTCVTCPTYCLAINGGVHGFIHGKRGLRQGDPMSPTLFLLCMEYLSRLLKKRTRESDYSFHAKCETMGISHLAFADDLLLFGRGDTASMFTLADTIDEFSSTSGLIVSATKSRLFFSNVPGFSKDLICERFGFSEASLPVRYLGLPLSHKNLLVSQFSPLIDKITACINRWNNSYLSLAGRAELIRSVVQGIECFWLQCLPLPGTVTDRIHTLLRRFLWGGRFCPVAWKTVCLPKNEGGLGFRNLTAWNKALLSKIIWDFQSKADSLWVRWVHTEILNGRNFWSTRIEAKDPGLIRNLYKIRDEILAACNGDHTKSRELVEAWFKGVGVSDAYEFFRPKGTTQFWHKAIWKKYIPPRYSITLWFALHGKLKTVDRMNYMDQPLQCRICERFDESHDHLFFSCPKTKCLWSLVKNWIGIKGRISNINAAIRFCKRNKSGSGVLRKARWIALATVVNRIWHGRNLLRHQNAPFIISKIFREVQLDVYRVLYDLFPANVVLSHMDVNTNR